MTTALIIVDIQNDYFQDGNMPLHEPEAAAVNAQKVLHYFRDIDANAIFHVQHLADSEEMGFFLQNTHGAQIHPFVEPIDDEEIIVKYMPNSFLNTKLDAKLQQLNVTDVVIVGMMTHMCIDATVRAALELGYATTVIADACATLDLDYANEVVEAKLVQTAFLSTFTMLDATVLTTEQYLNQTVFQ